MLRACPWHMRAHLGAHIYKSMRLHAYVCVNMLAHAHACAMHIRECESVFMRVRACARVCALVHAKEPDIFVVATFESSTPQHFSHFPL